MKSVFEVIKHRDDLGVTDRRLFENRSDARAYAHKVADESVIKGRALIQNHMGDGYMVLEVTDDGWNSIYCHVSIQERKVF